MFIFQFMGYNTCFLTLLYRGEHQITVAWFWSSKIANFHRTENEVEFHQKCIGQIQFS